MVTLQTNLEKEKKEKGEILSENKALMKERDEVRVKDSKEIFQSAILPIGGLHFRQRFKKKKIKCKSCHNRAIKRKAFTFDLTIHLLCNYIRKGKQSFNSKYT